MRFRRLLTTGSTALLVAGAAANAEVLNYQVTFTIGDVSSDRLPIGTGPDVLVGTFIVADGTWPLGNFDSTGDLGWAYNGVHTLPTVTPADNRFLFDGGEGSSVGIGVTNSTSLYNPYDETLDTPRDYTFAEGPNCAAPAAGLLRAYACGQLEGKATKLRPTPFDGVGPAATASGIVTVDTEAGTMTGTLTFDQRPGGPDGEAFSYRSGDGSPFNASKQVASTQATLAINFTGTFTGSSWNVTGGEANLVDPAFECLPGDFSGTLCNPSPVIGGFQTNGSHLSWVDIEVYDQPESIEGRELLTVIPGAVLTASLSEGVITFSSGEFHRPLGAASAGCLNSLVWDGVDQLTCGNLTAGIFTVSGEFVANLIPVANDDSVTTPVATAIDIPVLANDTLGDDPNVVTVTTPPANGTAVVQAGNTVLYTPNAGFAGNDSFVYTLTDADEESDTATVTIFVDDQPVAVADAATVRVLQSVNINVLANDTGLLNTPVTVTIVVNPTQGTAVVGAGNVVTYTAGVNGGNFPFTYRVTDSDGDFAEAVVTVTVQDAIPAAADDAATTVVGAAVTIDVLANDTGLEDTPVTVAIVDPPDNGTAVVQNNSIVYTPDADFVGQDTLTYRVTDVDGDQSNVATVTITVNEARRGLPGGKSSMDLLGLGLLLAFLPAALRRRRQL